MLKLSQTSMISTTIPKSRYRKPSCASLADGVVGIAVVGVGIAHKPPKKPGCRVWADLDCQNFL